MFCGKCVGDTKPPHRLEIISVLFAEIIGSDTRCIYGFMDTIKFNYLLNKSLTDKEAFSALYKYYYPRIILHIKRTYPKADAEEVAQEFFLNLLKRKSVKFVKNPVSWIYASCKNIIVKNHAKECAEISVEDNFFEKSFFSCLTSPDFVSEFEYKTQVQKIFEQIDDEDSKKIVYLYYWEAYNLREIAQLVGLKESTVRQKHRRALKKIKKSVSD